MAGFATPGLQGLTAIAPGYAAAQQGYDNDQLTQQQVQQQKLKMQQAQDDQAALVALGRAFGVAPPNQPPPQAPGQPSVPTPPAQPQTQLPPTAIPVPIPAPPPSAQIPQGGAPQGPPQGGPPQPGPQQGGPPSFAPTAVPPPGVQPINPAGIRPPQGGPPQGGPPPGQPQSQAGGGPPGQSQPAGPIVPGQATVQQLATQIQRANPGIKPDVLIRAMTKAQALLAPDEKIQLDQAKMNLDYDSKIQKIQADADAKLRTANNQLEIANIHAATSQAVADINAARANELADKNNAARSDLTDKKNNQVDRRQLVAAATKAGVPVKADDSDEQIQNLVAAKTAGDSGGLLPPSAAKFFGQAMLAGDNAQVQQALGFGGKNRPAILAQVIAAAQEIDPSFTGQKAAQAQAQYGGQKAAVTQTAKTGANVELGANEIAQTLPLATEAAKKLDLTQFPTINKLKNAASRGGLDAPKQAALAQLDQYQQAVKNAYRQVIARGGRSTVFDAKQADALMSDSLPIPVLIASGQAMIKEAAVNKSAVSKTMQDIAGQAGGASALPDNAKAQLKEGVNTKFGNGQTWTLQDGQPQQVTGP